jgi:hypothetical protein
MTAESNEIRDDLFLACALTAWIDQSIEEGGPPSSEATRKRAYAYYEEELAVRNRAKVTQPPGDAITPPGPRPATASAVSNPRLRSAG